MGNKPSSPQGDVVKKRLEEFKRQDSIQLEYQLDSKPDVLVYCRYEDEDQKKLADTLKDKMTEMLMKCYVGTPQHNYDKTIDIVWNAKAMVYLMGDQFSGSELCCDVVTSAQPRSTHVICKKPKDVIVESLKESYSGVFISFKQASSWHVFQGDISEITEKLISRVRPDSGNRVEDDGAVEDAVLLAGQKWKQRLMDGSTRDLAATEVPCKVPEGKQMITPRILCEDLITVSDKWERFGSKIGFTMDWIDKISSLIQGIEDVIDYCYLTVLETWLSGQKEELTKDSLVETLRLTGHPRLAKSISDDSSFKLNMRYLCKKLKPIKKEYRVYGTLLGLDLPDHNYLAEHMKDPSALYFTVIIMQWLQRDAGDIPSKKLLKAALARVKRNDLAERLLQKYSDYVFPGDDPAS